MIYLQGKSYSIDRWRTGRFTVYTIWNEKDQEPIRDFSTQDYRDARKKAIKFFKDKEGLKSS